MGLELDLNVPNWSFQKQPRKCDIHIIYQFLPLRPPVTLPDIGIGFCVTPGILSFVLSFLSSAKILFETDL